MKFRNTWIDRRVMQLRPADAKAYLTRSGWKSLGPASNPILEFFEQPGDGEDTRSVLVPTVADQGPMLQRMIDLVARLAGLEDRWAVDVLTDMLQPSIATPANGPAVDEPAESRVP